MYIKKLILFLLIMLIGNGCTMQGQAPNVLIKPAEKPVVELKTLRMQLKDNISTLDPALVQTKEERQAAALIFVPIKELAENWNVSADGKKYFFTLQPNLRFHNGAPLKASDVKFSWERAVYLDSPEKYIFSNIVGYWEFVTGKSTQITGIKVLNDRKLEVYLYAPNKSFLTSLTQPAAAVVDRFQVLNKAERFGKPGSYTTPVLIPNGSGPYKLFDWINNEKVILGINKNYHTPKPKLERIEISLENNKENYLSDYILGNLDSVTEVSQGDLLNESGIKGRLELIPLQELTFLRINPIPTNRALSDIRVRKALMLAADFRRIGLYLNSETTKYLPSNATNYLYSGLLSDKETIPHKTYDAAKLLIQAGYPGGKGLEFTLYYLNDPELKKAALLLKGQWSARGIRVHLKGVSKGEIRSLIANKTPMVYLDKWTAPYPALEAFYYPNFHSAFATGISQQTDQLIAEAMFTPNKDQQYQKFSALERIIEQQYIIRPLFTTTMTLLNKPWVKDLKADKTGNLTIEKADLKKE